MTLVARHIAKSYLRTQAKRHAASYPPMVGFCFDTVARNIMLDGLFEKDQLACLKSRCFDAMERRGTCLDVGANIGNHALFFADLFERVVAFEPHPRTFQVLSLNASLRDNIETLEFGLSDGPMAAYMDECAANMGANSIRSTPSAGTGPAVRVERLDDLVDRFDWPAIDFIKIDAEGREAACVAGADQTLRKHQPLVALEIHAEAIAEGSCEAVNRLEACGYRHFYDLQPVGVLHTLPGSVSKPVRWTLDAIGLVGPRVLDLVPIQRLDTRAYPMLVAAAEPVAG